MLISLKGTVKWNRNWNQNTVHPKDPCCFSSWRIRGDVVRVNSMKVSFDTGQATLGSEMQVSFVEKFNLGRVWGRVICDSLSVYQIAAPSCNQPSFCHWGHWVLWCPRGRVHSDDPVPFWHFYNRMVFVATKANILSQNMMFSES